MVDCKPLLSLSHILQELDKELRDDVQQLKALKEERMREVLKLKALDEKLCQAIKMEPIYVPTKVVPTDEQLETLKQHIREMEVSCHKQFCFRNRVNQHLWSLRLSVPGIA